MGVKNGKEVKFTKNDKGFIDLYWLVKIANVKDVAAFKGQLLVEDNKMVVTDGRRLHLLKRKFISIPKGRWKVRKVNKSEIILEKVESDSYYPLYGRIMPNIKDCKKIQLTGGIHEQMCQVIQGLVNNYINISYLGDVLDDLDDTDGIILFSVYIFENDAPILFKDSYREAMIQPLHIVRDG